jgi:hypothetical protein
MIKFLLIMHSFGNRSFGNEILKGKGVPGPGTYNFGNMLGKAGRKATMLPRRPDTAPYYGKFSPGPGTYTPHGIFSISSFKVGTEQRGKLEGEALKRPGPGAYNPSVECISLRPTSPQWGYYINA